MQEHRYDEPDRLTARASAREVHRALADPKTYRVTLHKPGSIFETYDGMRRRFRVRDDGSLERLRTDGSDLPWTR